jgi:hypothetical protein
MTATKPIIGQGQFQWNAAGWFGSLLGSTGFLALGAAYFLGVSGTLSLIWLACWTLGLGVGIRLWGQRDRVAPYPALRTLMATLSMVVVIAIVSLLMLAPEATELVELSPTSAVVCLAIMPALMLQFARMERRARQGQEN